MITGLGALSLLAVLAMAIWRGERAALITAVVSVLALNFLFVDPRYHLTVAEFDNAVALVVLFVVALIVGRLASHARRDADRAEQRAREAELMARAGAALLEADDLNSQLAGIGAQVEGTSGGGLRLGLTAAPEARERETVVRLPTESLPSWLYARAGTGWESEALERISEPLARLIDVARARQRAGEQTASAEASRQADVAKTALLHAISHDLRSPLTAITTAAGGLRDAGIGGDDRAALETVIDEESERLARMVDDLLDLSKIQAGAVNPRPDWCDLRDVAQSAAAQVRSRYPGHPIELELPDEQPLVQADAAQLERVIANLLENAVKFSPSETPVTISGGSGGGRVVVRVIDQGPGIPSAKQAQIFEPFFRGRQGESGSGLGLAICRGLVEANGGRIDLQSDTGRGTSFAVSFPLVRQPVEK
jgi:two-component system, OmpR family, sensor histidine kinase KdpD